MGDTVYGVRGFANYPANGSFTEDIARVGETGYTLFANKTSSGPDADVGSANRRGKGSSEKDGPELNGWSQSVPLRPMAMIAGRDNLYVVGVEDKSGGQDYWKYLEGREGGLLVVHSKSDGKQRFKCALDSAPVFDGLSAAGEQVFVTGKDGSVICMGAL